MRVRLMPPERGVGWVGGGGGPRTARMLSYLPYLSIDL